ncbi:hypothetical protein [Dactylosporangium sp. NPDC050588]|uniref:hypothetical protein n=1 Tax=Dactylosporangium sp. NPDC050588 TaxID=3157211 RepID=UPI0033E4C273
MNLTTILLIAAAILYVLIRRFTGEPFEVRHLVLPPVLLIALGGYQVAHTSGQHPVLDGAVLGAGALLAVAGGIVRGLTVRVFVRQGRLWYRYTAWTVVVWLVVVGVRFAESAAGTALGADTAVVVAALPLMFGLSLLGEAAVIGRRGLATGVPFGDWHRSSRRDLIHR